MSEKAPEATLAALASDQARMLRSLVKMSDVLGVTTETMRQIWELSQQEAESVRLVAEVIKGLREEDARLRAQVNALTARVNALEAPRGGITCHLS